MTTGRPLATHDFVVRAIEEDDILPDGTIHPRAFLGRASGEDDHGLFLLREIHLPQYLLEQRTGKTFFCSLAVHYVRRLGLDVIALPEEGHLQPALIIGHAERMAERLAQIAQPRMGDLPDGFNYSSDEGFVIFWLWLMRSRMGYSTKWQSRLLHMVEEGNWFALIADAVRQDPARRTPALRLLEHTAQCMHPWRIRTDPDDVTVLRGTVLDMNIEEQATLFARLARQ